MDRFFHGKQKNSLIRAYVSLAICAAVCLVFWLGISALSNRAKDEQQKTLEDALYRGVTQCYAIEGRYPDSLAYLQEEYGISYDEEEFFVDYQIIGTNIMPDITVIPK